MIIEGWMVCNFFTAFLIVLMLVFQRRGSRVKTGRMFTYILVCTLVLVLADTFSRIGENRGGSFVMGTGYHLNPVEDLPHCFTVTGIENGKLVGNEIIPL